MLFDKNELLRSYRDRIEYLFSEFDNIMIALSGSIESTLLLDLTYRIWKEKFRYREVCVFNIDTEISHSYSVDHIMREFERVKDDFTPYWIMLPTKIKHDLFEKEENLLAWDDSLERVLRPYPDLPYVITLENNPIPSYRHGMPARMLASNFLRWYKHERGGRTVYITGARLGEKHNKDKLLNAKKRYRNSDWIAMDIPDIWRAAPLFDFTLHDVWKSIKMLGVEYNEIYDNLFKRGDSLHGFRITPQLSKTNSKELRRFAEIDCKIWDELTKRIPGIELYSIYGDAYMLFTRENENLREEQQNEKPCLQC